MAIVGWLGVSTAQSIQANLVDVDTNSLPSLAVLGYTQTNLLLGQRGIRSAILATDPTAIKGYIDAGRKGLDDSEAALTKYLAGPLEADERPVAAPLPVCSRLSLWLLRSSRHRSHRQHPREQSPGSDPDAKQAATPAGVLNTVLPQLVSMNEKQAANAMVESQADKSTTCAQDLLSVLIVGIVLSLGVGFVLARVSSAPSPKWRSPRGKSPKRICRRF